MTPILIHLGFPKITSGHIHGTKGKASIFFFFLKVEGDQL